MSDGTAAQATIAQRDAGEAGRGAGAPEPILPAFGGPCLAGVVPGLLAHLSGSEPDLASWMPEAVAEATQIVLLVLDGLGAEQLRDRADLAPVLSAGLGGSITSVAPSTTACALTTLVTGRVPAEHGVVGYRVALDGDVMNVLQWSVGGKDARMRVPAHVFQPFPSFPGARETVPVVTRYDYGPTGFTAAHLGRVELHPWHTSSGLVTAVRQLAADQRPFIYAYYEGIDKVAHAEGLNEYYDGELRAADRIVGDVLEVLPPGAALVVTADHGQVDVGSAVEVLGSEIMDDVVLITGEGRFRWLHVRPGATADGRRCRRGAVRRPGLGAHEGADRRRGLAGRGALGRDHGAPGRRRPGALRAYRVPGSGRHRGAPAEGSSRVAHRGRNAGSAARLACFVSGEPPVATLGDDG